MRAQFHHGFLSNRRGSARFCDHRCYRRLGWCECVGHSCNREADKSLCQHAPQSGNAPTSRNQRSCQSHESHRNRWPGTTPCPVEVAQIGLVWRITRRKLSGNWASWVVVDPFEISSYQGATPLSVRVAEAPSFVAKKLKMAHILDQGGESEFTLADAQHITVWFHNYVAITRGQPDAEETPTNEQLSALNVRVIVQLGSPFADFAIFTPHARKTTRAHRFTLITCLSKTALGWRKKSLVQPIFTLGFIVGGSTVWRV